MPASGLIWVQTICHSYAVAIPERILGRKKDFEKYQQTTKKFLRMQRVNLRVNSYMYLKE